MRAITSLAAAVLAVGFLMAHTDGGTATVYTPPFAAGPSGGDQYNLVQTSEDGRITVGRAYPVPSAIGCSGRAGYASFEITHTAAAPVVEVTVDHTEAAVDPYTFLSVNVIDDDGRFLGSGKLRGLLVGDGHVDVPVSWPAEPEFRARDVRIQVGLELTSACPAVDGGTLRVPTVTVVEEAP